MAISTLSVTAQANWNWNCQNNLTGGDYNPLTNVGRITKQQAYTSGTANAALGGANEYVSYIISLAANTGTTVNCQALTDIMQTANTNLARIKAYMVRLLDPADDATYGTNCSSITFGNSGANAQTLNMGANTHTLTVKKGGVTEAFDQSTGGWTVDNTHRDILFFNDDLTNAAKIQLTMVGGTS